MGKKFLELHNLISRLKGCTKYKAHMDEKITILRFVTVKFQKIGHKKQRERGKETGQILKKLDSEYFRLSKSNIGSPRG